MEKENLLTIVLIIDKLSEYFDLTLDSLTNQTDMDYELFILDKNHLTSFEDCDYVNSENKAIYLSNCKYIYFMSDKDIPNYDFVDKIKNVVKKYPSKIYQFYDDNMSYKSYKHGYLSRLFNKDITQKELFEIHSTYNKIFDRKYLFDNYIHFNLLKHRYDMNHIMFNYIILANTIELYFINKTLIYHKDETIIDKNYLMAYKNMLEEIKLNIYTNNYVNNIKNYITIEFKYIQELIRSYNE